MSLNIFGVVVVLLLLLGVLMQASIPDQYETVPPEYHLDHIIDNVFLGDWRDSVNEIKLRRNGVKGILTLNKEYKHNDEEKKMFKAIGIKLKYVELYDSHESNISQHFDDCIKFIKSVPGPVLVHCTAGISRSPSVVIAYCMVEKKWSLEDALTHCKKIRPRVNPNSTFIKQLDIYSRAQYKSLH
jgi:protein-tyrosine phosphatase